MRADSVPHCNGAVAGSSTTDVRKIYRDIQRPHPATFPVQLAEWCIKLHGTARAETMVDPFLGIGNSAVAAKRCDVKNFVGFEIDEAYVAEAKRRVANVSTAPRPAQAGPK